MNLAFSRPMQGVIGLALLLAAISQAQAQAQTPKDKVDASTKALDEKLGADTKFVNSVNKDLDDLKAGVDSSDAAAIKAACERLNGKIQVANNEPKQIEAAVGKVETSVNDYLSDDNTKKSKVDAGKLADALKNTLDLVSTMSASVSSAIRKAEALKDNRLVPAECQTNLQKLIDALKAKRDALTAASGKISDAITKLEAFAGS